MKFHKFKTPIQEMEIHFISKRNGVWNESEQNHDVAAGEFVFNPWLLSLFPSFEVGIFLVGVFKVQLSRRCLRRSEVSFPASPLRLQRPRFGQGRKTVSVGFLEINGNSEGHLAYSHLYFAYLDGKSSANGRLIRKAMKGAFDHCSRPEVNHFQICSKRRRWFFQALKLLCGMLLGNLNDRLGFKCFKGENQSGKSPAA